MKDKDTKILEEAYSKITLMAKGKMYESIKKFNIENINTRSFEVDGIDRRDAPDFADAYISYASWNDGTPLTDDELEILNTEYPDVVYSAVENFLH